MLNITAEDDAGIVGTASNPLAVFASGTARRCRPMRGDALSVGDEIIQSRSAEPSPPSLELSPDELLALQAVAVARGYDSVTDLVRSLLPPHPDRATPKP